MQNSERLIIRELAKKYIALANADEQQRANHRMKDTNDLKTVRPPVLIDEIPWHELMPDPDLVCLCEDPVARRTEWFFRRALYQKKHFRADLLMPSDWKVRMAYEISPLGVEKQVDRSVSGSKSFKDVLEEEESLEQIKEPSFSARPDLDEKNMNFFTDLFHEESNSAVVTDQLEESAGKNGDDQSFSHAERTLSAGIQCKNTAQNRNCKKNLFHDSSFFLVER